MRRFPDARRIALHAGGGANGGDGNIAAEILRGAGTRARRRAAADVVIDALLGTGLKGAPRDETSRAHRADQRSGCPGVAVDIPSGVNASTGEVAGAAVNADVTVTMHGPKVGLAVAPGRFHAGEVAVADIGLEPAETEHRLVTPEILAEVPRRSAGDNKYTAGHVLVVGGSRGMTGAPALAARAALRADAGYVTIAAPAESLPVLETLVLEAVKRPLERRLRSGGEGRGARGRARPRPREGLEGARPSPARGGGPARCRRRRRALRARARRVAGAARPHPARGRARAPARARVEGDRGAPARVGAGGGGALPRCRRAQGRGLARRGARPRRARLRARPPVARDGGHGRRPHRRHGRLPREGYGAAARGRGRVRGAAARLARGRRSAMASSRATWSRRCRGL